MSRFKKVGLSDNNLTFNTELVSYLELENLLEIAEVILLGAINRKESRGAHFRDDFPQRDDKNWLKHTIAHKRNGKVEISYEPVRITKFKPQARVY
jgi:succinate dehydrogenase / fumarate reductase flavoprotein subunit